MLFSDTDVWVFDASVTGFKTTTLWYLPLAAGTEVEWQSVWSATAERFSSLVIGTIMVTGCRCQNSSLRSTGTFSWTHLSMKNVCYSGCIAMLSATASNMLMHRKSICSRNKISLSDPIVYLLAFINFIMCCCGREELLKVDAGSLVSCEVLPRTKQFFFRNHSRTDLSSVRSIRVANCLLLNSW